MPASKEKRRSPRIQHRAIINVKTQNVPDGFFAEMANLSGHGLFVNCANELMPTIDELIHVQTTEFENAPLLTAKVMRIFSDKGFGIEFQDSRSDSANPDTSTHTTPADIKTQSQP